MDYQRLRGPELASLFATTEEALRQGAGSLLETHDLDYRTLLARLPTDVVPAHDGLTIELPVA